MTSTSIHDFQMAQWLPLGLSLGDLVAALAGFATLMTIVAIWHALSGDSPFERRFAHIVHRKELLRQAALAPRRRQRPHMNAIGLMRQAVTRLNLLRSQRAGDLRGMLLRAGIRSKDAIFVYLFAQVTVPFLFAGAVLLNDHFIHFVPIPARFELVFVVIAAAAGFYAPKTYLTNAMTRRAKQLQLALPDGLDLMVICAESGLSLDATLVRVSREIAPTWPELGEELSLTAAELTFLPDRQVALENLNYRTNSDGVRAIVNTLMQTAKYGTPLANSLRVLASEFRTQRMMKAEEKAARLPALLTVPMMIFILPTLFIVLLGPAAINAIDAFSGRSHAQPTVVSSSSDNSQASEQPVHIEGRSGAAAHN